MEIDQPGYKTVQPIGIVESYVHGLCPPVGGRDGNQRGNPAGHAQGMDNITGFQASPGMGYDIHLSGSGLLKDPKYGLF
jgi:hypothetical protein